MVLTAAEIQRRLGISKSASQLLKRRLQILASDQRPKIERLIFEELRTKYKGTMFPRGNVNITDEVKELGNAIPQADSMALFSLSTRANGGRKRFRHSGLTASIYMSDRLGGHQKGTLVHTLGWKQGPVLLDSIPNLQGSTVMPLLNKYLPTDCPVFTDEGYKFYYRINKNHRMVNHSAKSKNKKYRWARNRWSKNGIHCQFAEGIQSSIKTSFRAYRYFKPEYSTLYLNEWSFWRNMQYFGWGKLVDMVAGEGDGELEISGGCSSRDVAERRDSGAGKGQRRMRNDAHLYTHRNLPVRSFYNRWKFTPVDLKSRRLEQRPELVNSINPQLEALLQQPEHEELRKAVQAYRQFWLNKPKDYQAVAERRFSYFANKLWESMPEEGWIELQELCDLSDVPREKAFRIIKIWACYGTIRVVDRTVRDGISFMYTYDLAKTVPILPDVRYQMSKASLHELNMRARNTFSKNYRSRKKNRKY